MKYFTGVGRIASAMAVLMGIVGCYETSGTTDPPEIVSRDRPTQVTTLYSSKSDGGLNTGAGHNWAQMAPDGSIGVVYYETQTVPGHPDSYRLILVTVAANGQTTAEEIPRASRMENGVLVYDSSGRPHVFGVLNDGTAQSLLHFSKDAQGAWVNEVVSLFANRGGEYLMEVSAAVGPRDSLHLAVLQFGTNPDQFLTAHENSNLFYFSNQDGAWRQEQVEHFDSVYILMNIGYWYMRPLRRQDLAVDAAGHAHIVYGALLHNPAATYPSGMYPTEMRYATNSSGTWSISTAQPARDTSSDAGYNPSVAIDSQGHLAMASTYMERVPAGSAETAQLIYSEWQGGSWRNTVLMQLADGYLGYDQGRFSGAIPHLRFDAQDHPYIIFSDIASSHVGSGSFLNVGQIRLVRFDGQRWESSTLYRQQSPQDYDHVQEIHGQCLVLPREADKIRIIAKEFISQGAENHAFNLLFLHD